MTDDGTGLPTESLRRGLGSTIIRSLAAQLGAAVTTDSAPGQGTCVAVSLPLDSL